MLKFSYANDVKFNGEMFYEKYKAAYFLKDEINVRNILSKQGELDRFSNGLKPGQQFTIEEMYLEFGQCVRPLILKKSGRIDESDVPIDEFTPRRLWGLTAAYVLDNLVRFPDFTASEAEDLGLEWRIYGQYSTAIYLKIYLSAVSGAEYFVDHFGFYPHVCGLKKYQLKLINAERLIDMTKIRSTTGERVSIQSIYSNGGPTLTFLGTFDVNKAVDTAPEEVKWLYKLGDIEWAKRPMPRPIPMPFLLRN